MQPRKGHQGTGGLSFVPNGKQAAFPSWHLWVGVGCPLLKLGAVQDVSQTKSAAMGVLAALGALDGESWEVCNLRRVKPTPGHWTRMVGLFHGKQNPPAQVSDVSLGKGTKPHTLKDLPELYSLSQSILSRAGM